MVSSFHWRKSRFADETDLETVEGIESVLEGEGVPDELKARLASIKDRLEAKAAARAAASENELNQDADLESAKSKRWREQIEASVAAKGVTGRERDAQIAEQLLAKQTQQLAKLQKRASLEIETRKREVEAQRKAVEVEENARKLVERQLRDAQAKIQTRKRRQMASAEAEAATEAAAEAAAAADAAEAAEVVDVADDVASVAPPPKKTKQPVKEKTPEQQLAAEARKRKAAATREEKARVAAELEARANKYDKAKATVREVNEINIDIKARSFVYRQRCLEHGDTDEVLERLLEKQLEAALAREREEGRANWRAERATKRSRK